VTVSILPKHSFTFNGCRFDFFSAEEGQGLEKHEHAYPHLTFCAFGELLVRKDNFERVLSNGGNAVLLKPFEWHELEALKDNTVFFNVVPDYGSAPSGTEEAGTVE
jgi:quercetin dioxygenase-like cupin family protein